MDLGLTKINPEGIRFDKYMRNPIILNNFQHHISPIGKCIDLKIKEGQLQGVAKINLPRGKYRFRNGRLGFISLERHRKDSRVVHKRIEIVTISTLPISEFEIAKNNQIKEKR